MNTPRRLAAVAVASVTSLAMVACADSGSSPQPNEQTASAPAGADTTGTADDSGATDAAQNSSTDDNGDTDDADDDGAAGSTQAPAATDESSSETISKEEAEQIAFDDAGVTREEITEWDQSELDMDNGRQIWEIEFDVNDVEYEYDIDALTGDILAKEID